MRLFPWQDPPDPHRALLLRAQRGDRQAFRALYEALYEPVTRFLFRRIRSRADAEDLTSRVFHGFVEHLADIDPDKGSARMFVLTMARNAVIDFLRQKRENEPIDDAVFALVDERGTPLDSLLGQERIHVLRNAVAKLPVEMQELLLLRHGDGLKHAEIAEITGDSLANVKQKCSRAQRMLRELVLQNEAGQGEEAERAERGDIADVRL